MELKEYLRILQKEKKTIIASIIVLMVFATIFTIKKPLSYDNDLMVLISRNGTQPTADYKYDGYYAVQSSDIFADNVSQWLMNASVAGEIYSRAGVDSNAGNFKGLSKAFKAKKLSSQYVEVTYSTKDEDSAKKIAHAMVDVLQEKTDSLNKASNEEIAFKIIYNDPLTIRSENNIWINNLLAIVGGLFIGIFLALGKNYLSE